MSSQIQKERKVTTSICLNLKQAKKKKNTVVGVLKKNKKGHGSIKS